MNARSVTLESLEQRTLLADATTGTIFGTVFLDNNSNGVNDEKAKVPARKRIFLDDNRDRVFDRDKERSITLATATRFTFNDLPAGTYRVAYDTLQGFQSLQKGGYNVTVRGGQTVRRTIPVIPPGIIRGQVFLDGNGDGKRQLSEPFVNTPQRIYIDLNNNGVQD